MITRTQQLTEFHAAARREKWPLFDRFSTLRMEGKNYWDIIITKVGGAGGRFGDYS